MIVFCPRHRIGFNDELDPVCPQCTLASFVPPDPLAVDQATLEVVIPVPGPGQVPIKPANVRSRR